MPYTDCGVDDTMELQDVDAWESYEYDDRYECGCCMCCGCDCLYDPDYDLNDDVEEGF